MRINTNLETVGRWLNHDLKWPAVISTFWLLAALPAGAQYSSLSGSSWNNPVSALADSMITQSIQRNMLEKQLESDAASKPENLLFRHAGRPLDTKSMAEGFARDPQGRAKWENLFEKILDRAAIQFASDGSPYDLAKAYAFYVSGMYSVLHPEVVFPKDLSERLLRQFRTQLLNVAAVGQADDITKQKLWEWLIVHGTMVQVRHHQSLKENDVKGTAAMRGVAEQRLKSLFKTEAALVRIDVNAQSPLVIGK